MSSFIATVLKFNKDENKFYLRGGSSNVVPRSNNWTHYESKEFLILDLISGCLDLRCSNKLSIACKEAIAKIEQNWESKFGKRNIEFGGSLSINPYSLYYISNYSTWNKEETLKNKYDFLPYISAEYKLTYIEEVKAIEEVWDEAVIFFNSQIQFFFNHININ